LILDHVKKHIRDRSYMSGVERSTLRVKATQEVFTPTPMVQVRVAAARRADTDVVTRRVEWFQATCKAASVCASVAW
jgi:hypothetical protein